MSVLIKSLVPPIREKLAAKFWRLRLPWAAKAKAVLGQAMHTKSKRMPDNSPSQSVCTLRTEHNEEPTILPKERDYFHAVLENSIHYASTIVKADQVQQRVNEWDAEEQVRKDWCDSSPTELLAGMKILRYHALSAEKPFEAERYEQILNAITTNLSTFDDKSVKTLLEYLRPLANHFGKDAAFLKLRNKLNVECINRFVKLSSLQEKFLLADMLHNLDRTFKFNFLRHVALKIGKKPQRLTPRHLVQLLYLLTLTRKLPFNMYEVEYRFNQCMDVISIDEIGIVALGFFKCQTRIRDQLLLIEIIRRLSACANDVHPITLGAIMKLLRYSLTVTTKSKFNELLIPSIIPQVPRLPLSSLSHFVQTMAKLGIYDRDLFVAMEEKYISVIKSARIKEMARILYSISLVAPEGSHERLYTNTIEELTTTINTTRNKEDIRFPLSLPHVLLYLSYKNIYPQKLIEYVMGPERICELYGSTAQKFPFDLCALDYNLKVDLPNYTGPTLKDGLSPHLMRNFRREEMKRIETNKTTKLLQEIATTCKEMLHSESVYIDLVLPQYPTKDIIVAIDRENRVTSVKEQLSAIPFGTIKRVDRLEGQEDVRWIVLVVCPRRAFINDSANYNCVMNAKLRQLRRIGYTPVTVSIDEWEKLNMTEKHAYLRNIMKI